MTAQVVDQTLFSPKLEHVSSWVVTSALQKQLIVKNTYSSPVRLNCFWKGVTKDVLQQKLFELSPPLIGSRHAAAWLNWLDFSINSCEENPVHTLNAFIENNKKNSHF